MDRLYSKMPPTVLKQRHDLKSVKNLGLKLLKKIKEVKISARTDLARIRAALPTDDLSEDDCKQHFTNITGEDAAEYLGLNAVPVTDDNLRKLIHVTIILANEIGQPAGAELQAQGLQDNQDSGDDVEQREEPPRKKGKRNEKVDLLQRLEVLERGKESIKDLYEKVRNLALQANPSESLIRLSLDELAKKARRCKDDDTDTYEELARQALRHQGSVNIATLTLNVLGGKASDLVGKAMAKYRKGKEVEQKSTGTAVHNKKIETTSPMANLYPSPCLPSFFPPQFPNGWQSMGAFPFGSGPYSQGPRRFTPRNGQWRPRGGCYFCGSMKHSVRDCDEMKDAKKK